MLEEENYALKQHSGSAAPAAAAASSSEGKVLTNVTNSNVAARRPARGAATAGVGLEAAAVGGGKVDIRDKLMALRAKKEGEGEDTEA